MSPALRIAVIVASTRTNRFADYPLAWITAELGGRAEFDLDIVDLREHVLPYYDLEATPAAAPRHYATDLERALGERLDAADGFLFITNEFNHSFSAPLKNTLDHFYAEFNHKPAGFLGYGGLGGARAVEQLRLVASELQLVPLRNAVHIVGTQMGEIRGDAATREHVFAALQPKLELLAHDLVWWGTALRTARAAG